MGNISEEMALALSHQNTHELRNSQIYYKIESWFREQNLEGFVKLMVKQKEGEREHSQWLVDFITDREGIVTFEDILKPDFEFETILEKPNNLLEVFNKVLETEQLTTKLLEDLCKKSLDEGDWMTFQLMQSKFIPEQVEEENLANTWIQKAMMIGGNTGMIMQWNEELLDE